MWTTSSILPALLAEDPLDRVGDRGCRLSSQRNVADVRRPGARSRGRWTTRGRRSEPACRCRCRPRRSPRRQSASTDSEPISPPEPVMIATGISPTPPCPPGHRCSGRSRSAPRPRISTRRCRRGSSRGRAAGASRSARKDASNQKCKPARHRPASPRPARSELRCRSARGRSPSPQAERGCILRPPPTFAVVPSQSSGSSNWHSTRSTRSSICRRSRTCLPAPPKPM